MNKTDAPQITNEQRIDILCEWIEKNLGERISWADLSRESGLGNLALRLSFLKYRFMTPMTFIKLLREEAKKILKINLWKMIVLRKTKASMNVVLADVGKTTMQNLKLDS